VVKVRPMLSAGALGLIVRFTNASVGLTIW
jgi:hypothetical protein